MGYDLQLAERVRSLIKGLDGFEAKEMFGGVGFMLGGNMACGVSASNLIVRVGPDAYEQALEEDHVEEFDMTGRPMRGWVVVTADGLESNEKLDYWVQRGVRFAQTLPPK